MPAAGRRHHVIKPSPVPINGTGCIAGRGDTGITAILVSVFVGDVIDYILVIIFHEYGGLARPLVAQIINVQCSMFIR